MLDLKLTKLGPVPQFPSTGQMTLEDKRDLAQSITWQDSCSGPSHQLHPILFFGRSELSESCSGCSLCHSVCSTPALQKHEKENRSRWSLFILVLCQATLDSQCTLTQCRLMSRSSGRDANTVQCAEAYGLFQGLAEWLALL